MKRSFRIWQRAFSPKHQTCSSFHRCCLTWEFPQCSLFNFRFTSTCTALFRFSLAALWIDLKRKLIYGVQKANISYSLKLTISIGEKLSWFLLSEESELISMDYKHSQDTALKKLLKIKNRNKTDDEQVKCKHSMKVKWRGWEGVHKDRKRANSKKQNKWRDSPVG